MLLFLGVALVVAAIVPDAIAYSRLPHQQSGGVKGLVLAVLCGILMGNFYRFVAAAMPSPEQFADMPAGKLGPYTAVVCFSLGILLSNFVLNTAIMCWPFTGRGCRFSTIFVARPGTICAAFLAG